MTFINFHNPEVIQEVKQKISAAYEGYTDQEVKESLDTLCKWQLLLPMGESTLLLSNKNLNDNHLSLLKILFNYNQQIETLYLDKNSLTEFDASHLLFLKNLYLSHNNLTIFDGRGLKDLRHIYLEHNRLTTCNARNLPSLFHLNLSHNLFTRFDGSGLFGVYFSFSWAP